MAAALVGHHHRYTIHGRYFWTGKGFGVNLADDDGFRWTSRTSSAARTTVT